MVLEHKYIFKIQLSKAFNVLLFILFVTILMCLWIRFVSNNERRALEDARSALA